MNQLLALIEKKMLWHLPLSFAVWLAVTYVTSRTSGWHLLAEQFHVYEDIEGDAYRFASGSMGKRFMRVKYSNSLFITVGKRALYISVFFPLRFAHPPLLIPWSQIESVETKRTMRIVEHVEIKFKDKWPVLHLRGRASKAIVAAFNIYSQDPDGQRNNWRNK